MPTYTVKSVNRSARGKERWAEEDCGYDTPCWIWQMAVGNHGYGVGWTGERTTTAHRMIYEALVGEIPDGLDLDHLCRVRTCVNPDHLEPVTRAENLRRGPRTKLTPEQVAEIRSRDEGPTALAERFGVTLRTIHDIRYRRRSWKEVA